MKTKREKLAELTWRGNQIASAIKSYRNAAGLAVPGYPSELEDLLEDKRFMNRPRYLRKVYVNPLARDGKWETLRASGGGIVGVKANDDGREYVFAYSP